MIRNLKVLSMALGALLAMGAMTATGAVAQEEGKFHAEQAGATLTGEQVTRNTFTVEAGTTHCEVAKFESQEIGGEPYPKTTDEVTVSLNYDECRLTAFGGEDLSATVHERGCHYLLTDDGTVHVQCPGTARIEVTAPLCTVRVAPQTVGTVDYVNVTKKEEEVEVPTGEVDVVATVTGITYTQTAFCPKGGGTFNNGTYNGTVRVKGETAEGAPVPLSFG